MNFLTSLHFIFQHKESLRQEEEVEATGLEEEVEATRLEEEDLDKDGGHDSEEEDNDEEEEEEGHEEGQERHKDGAGLYNEGVGVTGLLQDPHPHAESGLATSFTIL
jgi:hypothetical protein